MLKFDVLRTRFFLSKKADEIPLISHHPLHPLTCDTAWHNVRTIVHHCDRWGYHLYKYNYKYIRVQLFKTIKNHKKSLKIILILNSWIICGRCYIYLGQKKINCHRCFIHLCRPVIILSCWLSSNGYVNIVHIKWIIICFSQISSVVDEYHPT
jgi:hypothetical protein